MFRALLLFVLSISVICPPKVFSKESSSAFLVTIFERKLRVVSPTRYSPHIHVILKNETLDKIVGKIQTESGRVIDYVNLEGGEMKSVPIGHIREEKIFYYPLAPSFQKMKLIIGHSPYEIPKKK
ncbi:MAG: hypothetical protein OXB88_09910 [Bacteriovoracales bacterium]|nr:hypothetical protein [Bacteriovoracales bacterium]